jgi:hypothetical protein
MGYVDAYLLTYLRTYLLTYLHTIWDIWDNAFMEMDGWSMVAVQVMILTLLTCYGIMIYYMGYMRTMMLTYLLILQGSKS